MNVTHLDFARGRNLAVDCTRQHLTFGGRCLNCGYRPLEVIATDNDGCRYYRVLDVSTGRPVNNVCYTTSGEAEKALKRLYDEA